MKGEITGDSVEEISPFYIEITRASVVIAKGWIIRLNNYIQDKRNSRSALMVTVNIN